MVPAFTALTGLGVSLLPPGVWAAETKLDETQQDLVTSAYITEGTIVDADISGSAAIADTKLATIGTAGKVADTALSSTVTKLGGTIESAEITDLTIATDDLAANAVTSAKILDLTIATADLADNAVTGAKMALTGNVQGDVMYYDGTDWIRLGPGTSGQFLKTQGASANPLWADAGGGGAVNLLANGSFEAFSAGASAAPDGWTLSGTGATVAKETTTIKHSATSVKPNTNGTNDAILSQSIFESYFKGRQVSVSVWANAAAATRVRVALMDTDGLNVERTYSGYHSGVAGWEQLTVTKTLQADATDIKIELRLEAGAALATYFDGAVAIEGASAPTTLTTKALSDTGAQTLYGDLQLESPTGANVALKALRGAATDVALRWNETTDKWEFTNDGTTYASLAGVSTGWYQEFTASASQTVFTLSNSYTTGNNEILVFYNGILQQPGAGNSYVETNSTTITFNTPRASGKKVVVMSKSGLSGGNPLTVGSAAATPDSTANASIAVNDTGGGNLLQLQAGGVDKFVVSNAGALTTGDVPWARLSGFPAACTAGQYVSAVGSTLTCGAPSAGIGVGDSPTWTGAHTWAPTTNITAALIKQTTAVSPTADVFRVANSGNTASFLNVTSAGNVGIGTTSPGGTGNLAEVKLQINSGDTTVINGAEFYVSDPSSSAIVAVRGTSGPSKAEAIVYAFPGNVMYGSTTNDPVNIRTNNTDKMTILANGNVGIGTTNPDGGRLDVRNSGAPIVNISGTGHSTNTERLMVIGQTATNTGANILFQGKDSVGAATYGWIGIDGAGHLDFRSNSSTDADPPHMRINTSGNVGIGTTTPGMRLHVVGDGTMAATFMSGNVGIGTTNPAGGRLHSVSGTAGISAGIFEMTTPPNAGRFPLDVYGNGWNGDIARFKDSDAECGSNPTTTGMSFSCSSDERLKTNIVEALDQLGYLTGIPIKQYTVKASGETTTGVIAQELLAIPQYADLVSLGPDGFYLVKEISFWKILKGIQELNAKLEKENAELNARLEALEAKVK